VYDLFGKQKLPEPKRSWGATLSGLRRRPAAPREGTIYDLFARRRLPAKQRSWASAVVSLLLHLVILLLVLGVFRRAETKVPERRPEAVAMPLFIPKPPAPPPAIKRQTEMAYQPPPGAVQADVAQAGGAAESQAAPAPAPENRLPALEPKSAPQPPASEPKVSAPAPAPPSQSKSAEPKAPESKIPAEAPAPVATMESEARRLFGPKIAMGGPRDSGGGQMGDRWRPSEGDQSACLRESQVRDSAGSGLATVTGRVYSIENHRPLPGAYLQVLGTPYHAFTDQTGAFVLLFDPALVANCRTQAVRVTAPGYLGRDLILFAGRGINNDIVLPRR